MPPPLRVFLQTADPALRARLSGEAARAGWTVVAREDDADLVVRAGGRTFGGREPVRGTDATAAPAAAVPDVAPRPAEAAWDDGGGMPVEALTPRELDVLGLLADGAGNRAIAERLGISDHTVKFHLSAIFGKLGVTTRTAAVRRALRLGWIDT